MNNYDLLKNNKDIIRCKDCCHGYKSQLHHPEGRENNDVYFCACSCGHGSIFRMMYPDDFCYMGHKKETDDCNMDKVKDIADFVYCKDCKNCLHEVDGEWDVYSCLLYSGQAEVYSRCFCSFGTSEKTTQILPEED